MTTLLNRGLNRLMPLTLAVGLAVVGISGLGQGAAQTDLRPVSTITTTIPVNTWTVINSASPGTSYWTGSAYRDFIRVGRSADNNAIWRGFLQPDITSLHGRAITNAYLLVTLDHSYSCTATPVSLYSSLQPVGPTTNWSNANGYFSQLLDMRYANANETGGCGTIQPDYVVNFGGTYLTNALAQAVSLNQNVFTVGLRAATESNLMEWKKFHPTNIQLIVTYID